MHGALAVILSYESSCSFAGFLEKLWLFLWVGSPWYMEQLFVFWRWFSKLWVLRPISDTCSHFISWMHSKLWFPTSWLRRNLQSVLCGLLVSKWVQNIYDLLLTAFRKSCRAWSWPAWKWFSSMYDLTWKCTMLIGALCGVLFTVVCLFPGYLHN